MSDSFCQRLIDSCENNAERIGMRIVGVEQEVYTFGEMLRQIRSVAYRLKQEDIEFGDRVAVIGDNHPCWAVGYLAALYRGAVCVPLDPHGEIETITNFLENSEAKLAFISADFREKFAQIEERLGRKVPAVVWRNSPQRREDAEENLNSDGQNIRSEKNSASQRLGGPNGFQNFEDWTNTDFPESYAREIPKAKDEDTALLIYTSGTTGVPKGVPLTHKNIVVELDAINEILHLTPVEKVLSLLPLFHAYLQIVNLWVAVTYGCEVGYLKELTPDELSKAMKEFKPTILTTVPRLWYLFHKKIFDAVAAKPRTVRTLFRSMLKTNGFLRDNFNINLGKKFFGQVHDSFGGNLRLAISAGSRFDEAVAMDFHRLGFTILQGYGLTETSGAATATPENDNRVGSVGKAVLGAEIKIDNPDAEGEGEVLIRGEMVFKGYYRNPQATAEAFTDDGWFRSGDLGRFDANGHLYIVGRAKDVIVLPSGKNVHPEDLEVHYLKSPLAEELAILGVKDESEGKAGAEKLVAVVVPDFEYLRRNSIANSREAIRYDLDNLGRELPEYQRVRDYLVRSEPLPRTATRKIKRFELKKEIEANGFAEIKARDAKSWTFSDEDNVLLETAAGKALVSIIKQTKSEVENVHPEMNLEIDLGLDSLARAEIFAALEQTFNTEFEAEEAAKALTVSNVIHLLSVPSAVADGSTAGKNPLAIAGGSDIDRSRPEALNWSKIVKTVDEDIPEMQTVLRNRPFFSPFAFTVYKGFYLFFKVFLRLEVEGIENLKKMKRPFLVCPNHQSFLDPFIVCSTYTFDIFKNIFHVGAAEFFEGRIMGFVAKMLHVVRVDPDTQLMRAMKAGAIGLKNGKVLNIYPEGQRAFDGDLHEFKKGAAILATELDLPILPVALDGVYKVWARRSWRIRPAKVKIRFGEPIFARDIVDSSDENEAKYTEVTAHLKDTIKKMIDEMRRK